MKKKINWNTELSKAFTPLDPIKKEHFLQTFSYPKLNYIGFLLQQFHYLHKRVWIFSISLILTSSLLIVQPFESLNWSSVIGNSWIISALLPFLSLFTVTELTRSFYHHMAELETSCRFSYHQITMARILILGIGNFFVLILLLLLLGKLSSCSFGKMLIYFLTPYILTSSLCLWLLNYLHGKDGLYGCSTIACSISILSALSNNIMTFLYLTTFFKWWLFVITISIGIFLYQLLKLLNKTEEKQWNLFLME